MEHFHFSVASENAIASPDTMLGLNINISLILMYINTETNYLGGTERTIYLLNFIFKKL